MRLGAVAAQAILDPLINRLLVAPPCMSIKSSTINPPMLRKRNCRQISSAASMFTQSGRFTRGTSCDVATVGAAFHPINDHGDLPHLGKGGRWQAKGHIYNSPFYYIDYTLAQCCALQFWSRARRDPKGALDAYVGLCGLGGSAPFLDLVKAAGLVSPFADGALADVVREAAAFLGI